MDRGKIIREFLTEAGRKGGKARAAKHSKAQLSKWAKLGGRPPKREKPETSDPIYCCCCFLLRFLCNRLRSGDADTHLGTYGPHVSATPLYQRFISIQVNQPVMGLPIGGLALDTKTGLLCKTSAGSKPRFPSVFICLLLPRRQNRSRGSQEAN